MICFRELSRVFDVLPILSCHVETVVLLTHLKEPDDFLRIHVDFDELDITKSETKAIYNKVRSYVKDKYDLHVPNLYIAQVKRDFGIIESFLYNQKCRQIVDST